MKHFDTIQAKKMHPDAILPSRAHADDAGMDLYALEAGVIEPDLGVVVRTGIALAIPKNYVGLVADRSSMAKKGAKTSGGVIDAGYRGEIHIIIRNTSAHPIKYEKGERIAQLLILPVATPVILEASELDETSRGVKGFGSSGQF
jgi:dUTP pyrophosphatase